MVNNMSYEFLTFIALVIGIPAGFLTLIKFHSDLKKEISNQNKEISNLKTELKEDIANLKTELKEDIANLDIKISNNKTELKEEIANLKTELKEDIANTKLDIEKLHSKFDLLNERLNSTNQNLFYTIPRVERMENIMFSNGAYFKSKEQELEYQ
jgi:peptidoglycan hydrolase CwlO-like protein